MKIIRIFLAICIVTAVLTGCEYSKNMRTEVSVPILMFHDVKSFEGGDWSISVHNLREKMEFLLEQGYTPVSFDQLVAFVDNEAELPAKPVCITFDDGYYSNYKYVFPLVTELNIPVTIFLTCKTVRDDDVVPSHDENILLKMSADELQEMTASPLVSLQSHSFGLHGMNTTYSEIERDNALPFSEETQTEYKLMFNLDCDAAEKVLSDVGVTKNIVFSFPSGKEHKWANDVLRERGYRASVTTNSGHVNLVSRGKPESLFSLGRMNVNDNTTDEKLITYLEKK